MARPLTDEERQILRDNPELVMFMPTRRGLEPIVFLLVIPVVTMLLLSGALYASGLLFRLVDAAPALSSLVFVALCVAMPFVCLRAKTWYDEAYGCDRELRALLGRADVTVQVIRITGVVPQRAEVYAEADDGPFLFGIASTRNTFVPEVGERTALVSAGGRDLVVRPDPRTQSLLG